MGLRCSPTWRTRFCRSLEHGGRCLPGGSLPPLVPSHEPQPLGLRRGHEGGDAEALPGQLNGGADPGGRAPASEAAAGHCAGAAGASDSRERAVLWSQCPVQELLSEAARSGIQSLGAGRGEPLPEGTLPPPYPLALSPISVLCVLDGVFQRTQGLSALFLKPPLPQDLKDADGPVPAQKSMLLLMMRYLLPQLAQLSELWPKQLSLLRPSQRSALSGSINPVQRLLPHLGAVLCSAARHPGEPRRMLVAEVVVALRSLAEGPRAEDKGQYSAQVATTSTIVARLLSAAAAADRKEEKDSGDHQEGANSPRLAALDIGANAAAPPAKKARIRKETGAFATPAELQALREALATVVMHLPLQRSDSSSVASSVLRCLELLSRRETSTGDKAPERRPGAVDRAIGEDGDMMRTDSMESANSVARRVFHEFRSLRTPGVEALAAEALRRERMRQGEEEQDAEVAGEEEDDDDDMGEGGEGMDEDEMRTKKAAKWTKWKQMRTVSTMCGMMARRMRMKMENTTRWRRTTMGRQMPISRMGRALRASCRTPSKCLTRRTHAWRERA
ncbi:unnamed protein product [Effrenium voratum]|nr:unnamed protein product [Effrenium voratum]